MIPATMATDRHTMIRYRGDIAAIATARKVFFTGPLAALERDHPDVRFVYAMAIYAAHIRDGDLPGPYTDEDAETFARTYLEPDTEGPA